jgi:RNA polymerase sigma-70 factor (ECF subfamily)
LLTVARNRERDEWKSAARRRTWSLSQHDADPGEAPADRLARAVAVDPLADVDPDAIPDKRLELLFVCAHPAIDASVRTPLMLQAVLGFEAAEVARAFAIAPATMSQRLVRAKRRIRDARIPFAVPERRMMPERLPPVLEAVYGCAALTWRGGADSLAGEAQYLAVVLADLLEHEPEAWALAALTTLTLARRSGGGGAAFVPLDDQDVDRWDAGLIAEGDSHLRRAAAGRARTVDAAGARGAGGSGIRAPGRFELEAAIQSVHCARRRTGATDWIALRTLYAALLAVAPSLGASVASAAVIGRVDGPDAGLAALPPEPRDFQPWWAVRAELLAGAGRGVDAAVAFRRAAELAADPDVREYLAGRVRDVLRG